jgi:putative transposase
MRRSSPRPSSTWRTFLEAHIGEIVAIDFFVVPTLTFHLLFGFLILRHHRRELIQINVTDHPTAAWAAHQLINISRELPGRDSAQVPESATETRSMCSSGE